MIARSLAPDGPVSVRLTQVCAGQGGELGALIVKGIFVPNVHASLSGHASWEWVLSFAKCPSIGSRLDCGGACSELTCSIFPSEVDGVWCGYEGGTRHWRCHES